MNKNYKECFRTVICTYNTSLVYFLLCLLSFPLVYLFFYSYFSFTTILILSIGIGHLLLNVFVIKLCNKMPDNKRPYTSAFWVNLDTLRVLLLIVFILYYGSRFS